MFKIVVCLGKNDKVYYKLFFNDIFLTFDELAIISLCDVSPSKLKALEVGTYDILLQKIDD